MRGTIRTKDSETIKEMKKSHEKELEIKFGITPWNLWVRASEMAMISLSHKYRKEYFKLINKNLEQK